MEFLTSDIADLEEVSDEKLAAYYEENAENYRTELEIGFRHLFFSPEKRDDAGGDAKTLLASLNQGTTTFEQAVEQSDRTLLAPEFSTTALSIIGRQFGESFAAALRESKPEGDWFGPVESGYGLHLVKIGERIDEELPPLETIRENVLGDYRYDQRNKLNEQMLEELLENYEVVIGGGREEDAS
jgi:hypothetical protein